MDILAKLLGGVPRVRLLRLFLFNVDGVYEKKEIIKKIKGTQAVVTRELQALMRMGIVKKKACVKEVEQGTGRAKVMRKKRVQGYAVDQQFEYFEELQDFLVETLPIAYEDITRALRRGGRLRLVIMGGFFIHQWEQRLDLLIIGDKLNDENIAEGIRELEVDLGRELQYATLSTEDFQYRSSIQDRLVRDVLDYPHEVVLDRMGTIV